MLAGSFRESFLLRNPFFLFSPSSHPVLVSMLILHYVGLQACLAVTINLFFLASGILLSHFCYYLGRKDWYLDRSTLYFSFYLIVFFLYRYFSLHSISLLYLFFDVSFTNGCEWACGAIDSQFHFSFQPAVGCTPEEIKNGAWGCHYVAKHLEFSVKTEIFVISTMGRFFFKNIILVVLFTEVVEWCAVVVFSASKFHHKHITFSCSHPSKEKLVGHYFRHSYTLFPVNWRCWIQFTLALLIVFQELEHIHEFIVFFFFVSIPVYRRWLYLLDESKDAAASAQRDLSLFLSLKNIYEIQQSQPLKFDIGKLRNGKTFVQGNLYRILIYALVDDSRKLTCNFITGWMLNSHRAINFLLLFFSPLRCQRIIFFFCYNMHCLIFYIKNTNTNNMNVWINARIWRYFYVDTFAHVRFVSNEK